MLDMGQFCFEQFSIKPFTPWTHYWQILIKFVHKVLTLSHEVSFISFQKFLIIILYTLFSINAIWQSRSLSLSFNGGSTNGSSLCFPRIWFLSRLWCYLQNIHGLKGFLYFNFLNNFVTFVVKGALEFVLILVDAHHVPPLCL